MSAPKFKIKRGDTVVVVAGRHKGSRGKVLTVIPEDSRVVVEGVALVKRHQKGAGEQPGQIIQKEAAIHISNVALVDAGGARVKVALRTDADGTKNRVNRKTGATVQG